MNRHYPVEQWLFWIYLRVVLLAAGMALACLSVGHLALVRALRATFPIREQLFFSFALGLLIFGLGIFLLGIAHALGGAAFWLWPAACVAAGGPTLEAYLRRLRRHLRALARRRGPTSAGRSLSARAATVFGAAGVLLLYVNILTPLNAGYDARWYHFALAEHYAAAGAIARFPEGFFGAAWPHLASWLYTWAFLGPGDLFFHMELAAHLELVAFLATLAGLPVLVRWMLDGRRAPAAWAAIFLFPGILLYDSSLSGGADHVLALWALAVLLALRRVWRTFDVRATLLLACVAAGAALTKYQSVNVLAFPLLAAVGVWTAAMLRPRAAGGPSRGAIARAGALGVLALAALTAPHWLKNLLWYGDPFYPLLRGVLPDCPWTPGAVPGFGPVEWRPTGPFLSSLAKSVGVLFSFSFVPHDWLNFHGEVPVFGSLFTLCLPTLLLLPRMRRAQLAAAAALAGLFVWYWTFHQDRYLQALLPWMAAVVAAVAVRLWACGGAIRATAAAALALQIVWGGDVYSFPTHAMLWRVPAQATLDLLSTGHRQDWAARLDTGNELASLAPLLPRGSKLLVHESELRLGAGAMVVIDARGAQGAIDYAALSSPRAIWELLRAFGVTHVAWRPGARRDGQRLSDEVVFLNFAARFCEGETVRGALHLARMPARPPPAEPPDVVVDLCGQRFGLPLERLDGLVANLRGVVPYESPPPPAAAAGLIYDGCPPGRAGALPAEYAPAGKFAPFAIATRR